MEAVITTVHFDVELSDEERAAIHRILSANGAFEVLPKAHLAVQVEVQMETKRDFHSAKLTRRRKKKKE